MKTYFVLGLIVTALTACSGDPASTDDATTPSHLKAYYPFTGNAMDSSGSGSDGTVTGPALSADRHGTTESAYQFDSYDDYIVVSDTNNFRWTDQITVAAWMRPDSQRSQVIFRKSGAPVPVFELSTSATGAILFKLQNEIIVSNGYALNTWTHVAGTYDGQMMRLYINGAQKDSIEAAGVLSADHSLLLIGTRTGTHADTFGGSLDEIRIYDVALNVNEIGAIAQ